MSTTAPVAAVPVVHATVSVHPSILSAFEAFLAFVKPFIAGAEKLAPVAAAIDPALAPEITAGEAVVNDVEGLAGDLAQA